MLINSREKYHKPNSVSFQSLKTQRQNYTNLKNLIKNKDFFESLKDVDKLGEGRESWVFDMDENFVLKLLKHIIPEKVDETCKILESADVFGKYNFGQPVATIQNQHGGDIGSFLYKQQGQPNGITDWIEKYGCVDFLKELPEYMKKLSDIAKFPQKAYINMAEEFNVIKEKGYVLDTINPQNILLDYKNEAFNFVDISKGKNNKTYYNVFNSLIDDVHVGRFYKVSNMREKIAVKYSLETIWQKLCNGFDTVNGKDIYRDDGPLSLVDFILK